MFERRTTFLRRCQQTTHTRDSKEEQKERERKSNRNVVDVKTRNISRCLSA